MSNPGRHWFSSEATGVLPFYWRAVVRANISSALMVSSLMLLGAMLEMITVSLSVPMFDAITNSDRVSKSKVLGSLTQILKFLGLQQDANSVIVALLFVATTLFVARSGLGLFQQYLVNKIAHRLRRKTKLALFESSLRARYEDQSKRGRGIILQSINGPAGAVYGAIAGLGALFSGIFNSVLLLGLLLYLSWWAAVMVGLLAIVGVEGLRKLLDRRSYACGRVIYDLSNDLSRLDVDSIDGLKVIKAHVMESKMVEQQRSLLVVEERPMLTSTVLGCAPACINEVAASIIVLGLGGVTFLWPSMGMHFSTLVAFLLAIRRLSPAVASINAAYVELNRGRRNIEVIEEVLHSIPSEGRGGRPVEKVEKLTLDGVSFYYESRPEQWVLKNVDLAMRRGTITAVVGPTGSGKSTIANLLVGFYNPRSGSIFLNDVDLNQFSLAAWRRKIGYVSQDIFLFNTTLRENITLWDDTVSQAELEWAARVAQLHEFISALPMGYDTVVGDRGLRLSGGQCQRVAIARAILRHPEVLIFDEATSALDNLTESAVYEAISALRRDAIVLVIAHRLSTIKDADQIAVLSSGKVTEVGTHNILMSRGGAYAQLYDRDGNGSAEGTADLESGERVV